MSPVKERNDRVLAMHTLLRHTLPDLLPTYSVERNLLDFNEERPVLSRR